MTSFKAGDKAILDKKEVVEIMPMQSSDILTRVWTLAGTEMVLPSRLSNCHTVRILPTGEAREVNPLGDEQPLDLCLRIRWRETESRCRTLRYEVLASIAYSSEMPDPITGTLWYAYISTTGSTETFVLVKPVEK